MKYLDKYPECVGCPVEKYCGTVVGSITLCNSYGEDSTIEDLQLKEYYEDSVADAALLEEASAVYWEP